MEMITKRKNRLNGLAENKLTVRQWLECPTLPKLENHKKTS